MNDAASTLIAIRFDHPLKAQECLLAMLRIAQAEVIKIEDAAIIDKDDNGRIRLLQSKDINPGQGASAGGLYGSLIGVIGGPLGMLAGGALGAAAGGLWGKLRDIGIDDDHMKDMGERINPGENLLFLLLERIDQDSFSREMRRFDGQLFESTAPDALDAKLEESLAATV
ncbi:MAG: DUF1269 domain-containing protein [Actinomycetota bacterium]